MFIWILAILDGIVAISLLSLQFDIFRGLAIYSIIYLIIKGVIFIKDPFSIIDLAMAIYLILMLLGIKTFFTYIFVLYIGYKIFVSFA